MKNNLKKFTALTLSVMTLGTLVSCGNKTKQDSSDGKTEVTIGFVSYTENAMLSDAILSFNSSQSEYEIISVNYFELAEGSEDIEAQAVNLLNLDLVSGKALDIIAVQSEIMSNLIKKDMFTDLYSLMEKYDGVKMEDFLPNILEGFEINGKLPAVSDGFAIHTAIAKTELVGENAENWTIKQMYDVYSSLPDGTGLTGLQDSRQSVHEYIIPTAIQSSLNTIDSTCDFINSDFISALDFACEFPDISYYDEQYSSLTDKEDRERMLADQNRYIDNSALIYATTITDFGLMAGQSIYTYFGGEDITYVGYPSPDGNGARTSCACLYGIPENSSNKEVAWKFISYLLTYDENLSEYKSSCTGGIPVIRDLLDRLKDDKNTEDSYSIYSAALFEEDVYWTLSDNYITDEAVHELYDYICRIKFNPYSDENLINMVTEETESVLSGESTAEQCAEIVQDRAETYLSEQS